MRNKIYYLASCSTCRKIIKALPNSDTLEYHDIRENPITEKELDEMHQLSGSYEALFSKKAQLYKSMDLPPVSYTRYGKRSPGFGAWNGKSTFDNPVGR